MKITRTYLQACNFCNATGFVDNPDYGSWTGATKKITCPVCGGSKTIIVTETHENNELQNVDE
jgi:DnaJ-class molecular chaperone